MEPPEELRAQAAEWQQRAQTTVEMLVQAARAQNGAAGWSIAHQLYQADNEFFLAMVIGNLTMRIVNTERRADEAHGPLVTIPEQGMEMPEMPMWATSASDQMQAAVQHRDYKLFAALAVDSNMRAFDADKEAGVEMDFDHALRAMLVLDHQTTALVAAEALKRLYAAKRGT